MRRLAPHLFHLAILALFVWTVAANSMPAPQAQRGDLLKIADSSGGF